MREQATRTTWRKQCIQQFLATTFAGQAVLLDELRWAVLAAAIDAGKCAASNVTRSWLNSFARTIREQFSHCAIEKIPISDSTPIGIVARAAAYGLTDPTDVAEFVAARDPCILCRYRTDVDMFEPRYRTRYVTPQYHAATFRFFNERPTSLTYADIEHYPGTFIPATQQLSLIVPPGVCVQVQALAAVPWNLFGYDDLNAWFQVDPQSRLCIVKRNRRV